MTVITETNHTGEFILSAGADAFRDVTVLSGQDLAAGAVVGKVLRALAAAPNPAVVGTGNGTMTNVRPGVRAKVGTYVVTCTAAATHGGTFSVTDPDGNALPAVTLTAGAGVATSYSSDQIEFTITDGSTDFIATDAFTITITAAGTPVVVGTGNGTISAISMARDVENGTYRLECVTAPDAAAASPTTGTAGSNTGNGTMTAVTKAASAQLGTYTMTCTAIGTTPSTGASAGVVAAYAGNSGNGACASAAVGSTAIPGVYNAVCIGTGSNVGDFLVTNPRGETVGIAVVAVEFIGGGLTFTIADGGNDFVGGDGFSITVATTGAGGTFQVKTPTGEVLPDASVGVAYTSAQINFTINDGATNFVVGDSFTVAIAATGNGGEFRVTTPSGETLASADIGVAYTSRHVNFTLNDGATDFAVGDYFHVVVARPASYGKAVAWDPTSYDGRGQFAGILYDAIDASTADKAGVAIVSDAEVKDALLSWGVAITAAQKRAAKEQMDAAGISIR